jgi:uncharacterized membrane protein YgdD (TMEM256/DUF423 family)
MGTYRKQHLTITGIFGAIALIIGAFGAHALKPHLTDYGLDIFQTGVSYHFNHVLAMGLASIFYSLYKNIWFHRALISFMIGIIFFSGSLYLLALKDVMNLGFGPILGPITPVGGLFLIGGWVMIVIGGQSSRGSRQK